MRYIKDIPNSQYKISLFQWNGKYIVKIEAGGFYEQTYKLDETDILSVEEINALLDAEFMECITKRFDQMAQDLRDSCLRNNIY
ncbi:hypothetical protein [Salmonirosea aquatica]|uniref:Uncharacterized protein n=1 Tax=Salmonirosea aquatica TaxID=2654236 RepID=A0A7C9FT85_9BACT|nr:hypothetical protein [Cytophagaceae bacterium SJW1-29]